MARVDTFKLDEDPEKLKSFEESFPQGSMVKTSFGTMLVAKTADSTFLVPFKFEPLDTTAIQFARNHGRRMLDGRIAGVYSEKLRAQSKQLARLQIAALQKEKTPTP